MNVVYFKKWWLNLSVILTITCAFNGLFAQTLISGIKGTTPFVTTGKNVTAAISHGNGILQVPAARGTTITFGSLAPRGFAADGVAATFDTANSKGEYVQFAISPATGFDLNITGLSLMGNGTLANTTNHYAVAYAIGDSALFNTGGATFLDSAGIAGNVLNRTVGYLASGADTIGQNLSVLNGSVIYLRVYIWGAAAKTNTSQFTITRFILNGTATASKATFSTTNASICYGGSYLFNKTQYSTTGTYTYHTINSVGADSAAILNLTVGAAPITNTPILLVGCKSVTYNNVTYKAATTFIDTMKNASGCDSIYTSVTISIDCTPTFTSFTPTLAAFGDTVTLKGSNFTGATSVTFGSNKALSFSVVNDTTITALVDTGSSGIVTVVTPNGTVTLAGFVYNSATIITGIKTTSPFINAGKNVIASISQGKGILRAPAAPLKSITFGSGSVARGGFAADGLAATFDTANNKGEYVQFEVSPSSGYDLNISGITMTGNGTVASTTNHYAVALAVGDTSLFYNGGATFLDSAGSAGNILYRNVGYLVSGADTIGQNIKVANGSTAYLRVYLWGAAAKTNNSLFTITNFSINGNYVKGSPKQTFSTTTASICYGGSYLFNDSLYTTAGTYTIHKINSVGGDSAATLILTIGVAPIVNTPITIVGCKGVAYKNITYTNSTVLTDTLKSTAGCDSVYTTVNITIDCSPIINSFTPTYAAYSDTVTLKGINFSGATSVSFGGIKALSFTVVNDTTIKALVDTGASGTVTVVTPNGSVSLAGFVINSAAIISGIKTSNPFIVPGKYVTATISQGKGILRAPAAPLKSITFGSGTPARGGFAADGVAATFDTANSKGEYVQFMVKPSNGYDLNLSGFTMKGNGTIASTTNYYAVAFAVGDTTLFNTGGATFLDSAGSAGNILYRTNGYLVSGADSTGHSIKVSNGSTLYLRVYLWGAAARTNNSVFTITNLSINGSASVTTSAATFSTTNASICLGGSYLFNGNTYTTSGTYNYVTKNSVGADSTATLVLSVSAAPRNGRPVTVTGCNTVTYKNITYTSPAVINDTLKNVNGCDSLIIPVTIAFSCTPTITSLSSNVGVKGDSITLIGKNFTSATAVAFGGTAASSFVVVNDTAIIAVIGTGTSGSVTVTTANGAATLAGFTFSSAAVITGIKTATPFINAGNHITTAISHGAGILQVPSAPRGSITFGTLAPRGFAADGVTATVDTAISKGEYVQFTVSPASGYNLNISGITLKGNGTVANTTNHYAVAIAVSDSSLFNSGAATYIDSAGKTGNVLNITNGFLASGTDTAGQKIIVKNGSSIYLRVYLWGAAARTNNSQFTISNFLVDGSATAIPTSTTYDTICSGSSVLFNGTTYTKSGTYTVHFTNNIGFDSAAILVLTVNTPVTPSVKITSTASTINVGDTVKFTAIATNTSATPSFQWFKNKSVLFGSTASTYTTNSLYNGDSIFVVLFAGKGCFNIDTVLSGIVITHVNVALSGTVKNPLGTVIPSVSVTVGTNTVVTDSLGRYGFTVAQGSNDIITPTKFNDINKANGINGTDISLIQSHILKKVILNSPYKLLAGDVNNDGAVNGTDIALIKSLILKHITTFSGNRLWSFVDSSFVFGTPTKPFPYNDSISISNVATNKTAQNFIGIKLGDVNYDWNASILGVQNKTTPIELSNDNIVVDNSATEIRIPVRVKNFKNIMGMQYTLNFNSHVLELKSVENNLLNADYNSDFAAEGKLPFLWVDPSSSTQTLSDNTVLFELVFNKKGNLTNEDITLSSDITSVNAFDGNYATVGIVKAAGIITENNIANSQLKLYPNPIKDVAVISGGHISKVQVIDNVGKVVSTKIFSNATNPSISVGNLTSGAYRLQVQTTDGKLTTISMLKR